MIRTLDLPDTGGEDNDSRCLRVPNGAEPQLAVFRLHGCYDRVEPQHQQHRAALHAAIVGSLKMVRDLIQEVQRR